MGFVLHEHLEFFRFPGVIFDNYSLVAIKANICCESEFSLSRADNLFLYISNTPEFQETVLYS